MSSERVDGRSPSSRREGTKGRRTLASLPSSDAVEFESQGANTVQLYKAWSFGKMASSLLNDVSIGKLIPGPLLSPKEASDVDIPLAKGVAEEKLKQLGLLSYITLNVDEQEDLSKLVDPSMPIDADELESRRTVTGYKWKRQLGINKILESIDRESVELELKQMIEEAVHAPEVIVVMHLDLVPKIARRFRSNGIDWEDLIGQGNFGLLQAVKRYDWRREIEFRPFAIITIQGELQRLFRDKESSVRIPRNIYDNLPRVYKARAELMQAGTKPTFEEVAKATGLPVDLVEEILSYSSVQSYNVLNPKGEEIIDTIGGHDRSFAALLDRDSLRRVLQGLTERERLIIGLYFFQDMTQSQIAAQIGVSQMQVSRMLSSTLKKLREELGEDFN